MPLFYENDMPEFKAMKKIYAQHVHKFVSDWLTSTETLNHQERCDQWNAISRTKLGNLLKADVMRPKKYKNKYICFCQIVRPTLILENPTKSIEDITKMLGVAWKKFQEAPEPELSEQINLLWDLDQKRYNEEQELSKSLSKPKKSANSEYVRFCKAKRAETPGITMVALAALWAEEKQKLFPLE